MSPEAEALLACAREADDPTPDDERRVLAGVYGVVGSSALVGGVGASKAKLVAGSGHVVAKVGLAVVLSVASLATLSVRRAPPPSVLRPSLEVRARAVADWGGPRAPALAPVPRAVAVEIRGTPSTSSQARAASLREELELLEAVQTLLRRGDGAAALRLLDEHASNDRRLLAERRAARVLALCAVGRVLEARAEGAAFLRAYPDSPQRSVVERSCAQSNFDDAR